MALVAVCYSREDCFDFGISLFYRSCTQDGTCQVRADNTSGQHRGEHGKTSWAAPLKVFRSSIFICISITVYNIETLQLGSQSLSYITLTVTGTPHKCFVCLWSSKRRHTTCSVRMTVVDSCGSLSDRYSGNEMRNATTCSDYWCVGLLQPKLFKKGHKKRRRLKLAPSSLKTTDSEFNLPFSLSCSFCYINWWTTCIYPVFDIQLI